MPRRGGDRWSWTKLVRAFGEEAALDLLETQTGQSEYHEAGWSEGTTDRRGAADAFDPPHPVRLALRGPCDLDVDALGLPVAAVWHHHSKVGEKLGHPFRGESGMHPGETFAERGRTRRRT